MNFGAPEYVAFFLAIPLILVMFAAAKRKSAAERTLLLDSEVESELVGGGEGRSLRDRKAVLASTFVFLVLALIRPQFGYTDIPQTHTGIDLLFVVDVSKSMLAKDLSPSRLERVRFLILDLLPHLRGDRVGLVTFAGVSFLESPLTYDYATFRLFLDDLSPDLIPVPGTNLQSAIDEAKKALGEKRVREAAIILFTDGEAFAGDLTSAISEVKSEGIRVFTVGVGSEIGAPIPEETGYKRDTGGNVVLSKLNRKTLEEIAQSTGGAYLGGSLSGSALWKFFSAEIAPKYQRSEITGGAVRVWREYFQVPLFFALVLYLFLYRRPVWFR